MDPAGPDADDVLALFGSICDRTAEVLAANNDWGWSGKRATQYEVDLAVDAVCLPPLLDAGFAVLSEESGITVPDDASGVDATSGVVVVDPLDGSTNAALGLPWCATALCLVRGGVAEVGMVANLRTGERFAAVRGRGATLDGRPTRVSAPVGLGDAIVGVNGVPPRHLGWRQYRALGSTALDICSVAAGGLDGYVDLDGGMISVWDYLAAVLIVTEAGGIAAELHGRELLVLDRDARRDPVVASNGELLAELVGAAGSSDGSDSG